MAAAVPVPVPHTKEEDISWILKDLLKGQEFVHRLSGVPVGSDEAKGLIGEILGTFSRVISALRIDEPTKEKANSTELAEPIAKSEILNRKRKVVDGSDKRIVSRRSTRQSSTRIVQANTTEDGQLWRKYGQKEILNSKNPRSYFRCTHKFDQGCRAQRQVQKSEEDPTVFIITYMGTHTCQNASAVPQIVQSFSHDNNSYVISFESNPAIPKTSNEPGQVGMASPSVQPVKQDGEDDVLSNLTMADLTAGGDSEPTAPASEQAEDRGDVTSSLNCSLGDIDNFIGSDFDHLVDIFEYI